MTEDEEEARREVAERRLSLQHGAKQDRVVGLEKEMEAGGDLRESADCYLFMLSQHSTPGLTHTS